MDSQGKGQGSVNAGLIKSTNFNVAVKRYFIDDASEEAIKLIRHEVVLMKQLRHDNILTCIGKIKKHALKRYTQFTLNTSCFWRSS